MSTLDYDHVLAVPLKPYRVLVEWKQSYGEVSKLGYMLVYAETPERAQTIAWNYYDRRADVIIDRAGVKAL